MKNPIPVERRRKLLKNLLQKINENENEIYKALHLDLRKPKFETFVSEINFVIAEIENTISNLNKWTKPKIVFPSLLSFPAREYIYTEALGKVLIIAPWNYPFQLSICPLIVAIAAGNRVVLKPSEYAINTAVLISKLINETFLPEEAIVVLGDAELSQNLLKQKWDKIFFTGSVKVGKMVAKAAAENMTPVTLELGGKSPCIVDETANLNLTAKRIVWGKFFNAGQTCIAPDYVVVHAKEKFNLIKQLKIEIENCYSLEPEKTDDLARIINKNHFLRLKNLLENQIILFGGETNKETNYIAPTLIDEPKLNSPVMQDEIFGPILPIISYSTENELDTIINSYEKPLSLYVFSEDKKFAERIITKYSFGGGCVNDCLLHINNKNLPFGGVGESGSGAYHGKFGYDAFSHRKAIVKKINWFDIPFRYAPHYKKLEKYKGIIKLFSKI